MTKHYDLLDSIIKDICGGVFSLARIKKKVEILKDPSDIIYVVNELWRTVADKRMRCTSEVISYLGEKVCEANKKVREMSTRDSLTGLFNRRFLDRRLRMQLASTYRNLNEPFSVIMFDIDYFKKFNDICGHNAGDTVLKMLSEVISKNLRESDSAFRYGGEEFFILLEGTSLNDALDVARRLNQEVANRDMVFIDDKGKEQTKNITISAGVFEMNRENPIWLWYGLGGKKLVTDYMNNGTDLDNVVKDFLNAYSGRRFFFSRWGRLSKGNVKKNVRKVGDVLKSYLIENNLDLKNITIAEFSTHWIVKNVDNLMLYAKEKGRNKVAYIEGGEDKILGKSKD